MYDASFKEKLRVKGFLKYNWNLSLWPYDQSPLMYQTYSKDKSIKSIIIH